MKIFAPIAFVILAIVAHLVQNTLTISVAGLLSIFLGFANTPLAEMPPAALWLCMAAGALFTLGLFYAAVLELLQEGGRWERAVIRTELAEEVGTAVTPDEYRLLESESGWGTRVIPNFPGASPTHRTSWRCANGGCAMRAGILPRMPSSVHGDRISLRFGAMPGRPRAPALYASRSFTALAICATLAGSTMSGVSLAV